MIYTQNEASGEIECKVQFLSCSTQPSLERRHRCNPLKLTEKYRLIRAKLQMPFAPFLKMLFKI